jgi:dienelactone hydrolase
MAFETIKIGSGTTEFPADLHVPSGTAATGLVVIAYGTDGLVDNDHGPWKTMIAGYADGLVERGLLAMIPNYFAKTGTTPGIAAADTMMMMRDDWAAALLDSVAHARTLPRVDPDRIGLLGFSLGGHLVLRIRAAAAAQVLVEYFAPMLDGIGPAGHVPFAQIHHGTNDKTPSTDFTNAGAIEAVLKREGTHVELHAYEGAGHGFAGNDMPNRNASSLSQSRTLEFFEKQL